MKIPLKLNIHYNFYEKIYSKKMEKGKFQLLKNLLINMKRLKVIVVF